MCYTVANRLCKKVDGTSKVMLAVGNWARRNLSKTKYKGIRGPLRPILQYIMARRMAVIGTASEYNSSQRGLDGQKLRWIAAPARKKPCTHDSDYPAAKAWVVAFSFARRRTAHDNDRRGICAINATPGPPRKNKGSATLSSVWGNLAVREPWCSHACLDVIP